jgi:hypothetical protein
MFIPHKSEAVIWRWPIGNIAIIAACVVKLEGNAIQSQHISEAIQYRTLDRQLWV